MKIEKLTMYAAELLLRTPRLKFIWMALKSRKGPWVLARLIVPDNFPDEPFVRFWVYEMKQRRIIGSSPRYWRPFGKEYDNGPWEMGKRTMTILRREYEKFKDWPARYAREGLPMPQLIAERVYLLGKFLPEYDQEDHGPS